MLLQVPRPCVRGSLTLAFIVLKRVALSLVTQALVQAQVLKLWLVLWKSPKSHGVVLCIHARIQIDIFVNMGETVI